MSAQSAQSAPPAPPAGALHPRSASTPAAPQASAAGAIPGEYLTFRLGTEEYGIDILRVQEIRTYEAPTRIANAPAFIKGVINLRGVVVPIVDLRVKLGCERTDIDPFTVVIVLNVRGRVIGVVVDSVSDVIRLRAQDIQPAPELTSAAVDTNFITGISAVGDGSSERMLILVDIAGMLSSAEMGLIDRAR